MHYRSLEVLEYIDEQLHSSVQSSTKDVIRQFYQSHQRIPETNQIFNSSYGPSIYSTLPFQLIAKKPKVSRCQGLELDFARNQKQFLSIFFLQTQKTFHNTLPKLKNKKAQKIEIQKSVVSYIFVELSQQHVTLYFPSPCSILRKITNSNGGCRLNDPKGPFAASKFFSICTVLFYCIVLRLK